jgi:hypothetical protein
LKLEMSFAPQLRRSPSNAMFLPLIVWCGDPLTIVQPECPGMGQLHVSPTQATGIPRTLKWVALALTTLPPWVVASPRRMTFFIAGLLV